MTIPSGTQAFANSVTLNDPNVTLLDEGTLAIVALLTEISGTLEIENGGILSLGGGSPFSVDFAGTGGSLGLGSSGFTGTINAISTATGSVTISGGGAIATNSGDALDLQGSGGTLANPATLGIVLTGAVTGAATGISAIQNGFGAIAISTTGPIVGLAGNGILAENLNAADNSDITIAASGNVSGTNYGIGALTDGGGNVFVSANPNVTIAGRPRGIWAGSNGTGDVSVTTSSGDVVTSQGAGISAFNQATSIPLADASTIVVTANGTINSGPQLNPDGSQPAGILVGYKGGTTSTPNANVFGNVTIDSFANITASGGDGIRGYNYGTGDITVTDEANTTIVAPVEFGIRAQNYGSGNISITTLSGDLITSGASGISAVNSATAIANTAGSSISVIAHGTINSGTNLNPSGSQPQGIIAVYYGANGSINNAINGTVSIDNFANVVAAAGYGVEGFNIGNGLVTVTAELETSITGAQYGIGAYSLGTGSGGVIVNVLANATITAGRLYGLWGIQANSNNSSNISVTTLTGDIINSGGTGINSNNAATSAPSSSQISIIANGTVGSGFDMGNGGGSPGGIWAGYNNNNSSTFNSAIAGNVIIDSFATINAAAGTGVGMYNFGVGNVNLTLELTSAINAPLQGVSAFANGGGNVSIVNSGTITAASGIGVVTGTGTSLATTGSGVISLTNSGRVTGLGSSQFAAIQFANNSTQGATFSNTGTVVANLYNAGSSLSRAILDYNGTLAGNNGSITINNSGTISGNVYLGAAATLNNQSSGTWNVRGQNYFNGTSTIINAGIINFAALTALYELGSLTLSNSGTVNVAAMGAATIQAAVSGTGGVFNIGNQAGLEFLTSVAGQAISFGNNEGMLILDNPTASGFTSSITNLALGDIVTLQGAPISGISFSGSTLTVAQNGVTTFAPTTVSGALSGTTFNQLSSNTIVLAPTTPTLVASASSPVSESGSTAAFYYMKGATISESTGVGLTITSSDLSTTDTVFAEIDQASAISVTGTFTGLNFTSTAANIAVINAGSISSSGGHGLSTTSNSATGSATIVDFGRISGAVAGVQASTNGTGPTSVVLVGSASVNALSTSVITNGATATTTNTLSFASTPSWIGPGMTVFDLTTGKNIGTVLSTASTTVTLAANAANAVNSGDTLLFPVTAPTSAATATTSAILTFASTPPWIAPGMAVYDVTTGKGIGVVSATTGTTVTLKANVSSAVASGDTLSFASEGVLVLPSTGSASVTTAQGTNISATGFGILVQDQASSIPAANNSSLTVSTGGLVTGGTDGTAAIRADYLGGTVSTPNPNVFGNVAVNNIGTIDAIGGTAIDAFTDGTGNVTVSNAGQINPSTLFSPAPQYGIKASNFGSGNVTVVGEVGSTINSSGTGILAYNQATAIGSSAPATVTVVSQGTITTGSTLNGGGSAPSGINADINPGNANTYNPNVYGNVIVTAVGSITAGAGAGIHAFDYGIGDITIDVNAVIAAQTSATAASGNAPTAWRRKTTAPGISRSRCRAARFRPALRASTPQIPQPRSRRRAHS